MAAEEFELPEETVQLIIKAARTPLLIANSQTPELLYAQ
jgi:hypothetical protein